jgi:hypothetical protein
MAKPICVNLLVCERVLVEADGIPSLIRTIDLFQVLVPNPTAGPPVMMSVYGMARIDAADRDSHTIQLRLIRPSGEVSDVGPPSTFVSEPKIAGIPGGVNFGGPLGVLPKEMGLHFFVLMYDGEEIARVPFTLTDQKVIAPQ